MGHEERRGFPRAEDGELTLELKSGDFDAMTHTLNISASGLYCKVNKHIPLMSRVKLILMVPQVSGGNVEKKPLAVEGVVVREHPVIMDGETRHYDVAIFFDDLNPKAREMISSYVSRKKD
jgi:hypothetical protein